jgi:hypothetical protein
LNDTPSTGNAPLYQSPSPEDPVVAYYQSRAFPRERGFRTVFLQYFGQSLSYLMAVYAMLLLWLLAQRTGILPLGLAGGLSLLALGRRLALIRMKQKTAELGVTRQGYWVRNVYEVAMGAPAQVFPKAYAQPQRQAGKLMLQHADRVLAFKAQDWEAPLSRIQQALRH